MTDNWIDKKTNQYNYSYIDDIENMDKFYLELTHTIENEDLTKEEIDDMINFIEEFCEEYYFLTDELYDKCCLLNQQ